MANKDFVMLKVMSDQDSDLEFCDRYKFLSFIVRCLAEVDFLSSKIASQV